MNSSDKIISKSPEINNSHFGIVIQKKIINSNTKKIISFKLYNRLKNFYIN